MQITDTTINSTTILWEMNALKQHTRRDRDLGVIITETLDVTKHCVRAANKANAMLGIVSRLRILKITTLETRRVRADLLEVFKIINRLDNIFSADFFIMENEQF